LTSQPTPPTESKQVTVEVPENRLAEFYVRYGRFLAGRGRRHRHGARGARHRCENHGRSGEAGGPTPASPEPTETA
jgi:hypothetical protein